MGKRRHLAKRSGIADENVEFLPAFENRSTKPVNAVKVADVKRHQSGCSADCLDGIIQLFQPALGACDSDHVRALAGQMNGCLVANAA